MSLNMKERFARLDMSKLPESYKSELDEMSKQTYEFTDQDLNDIFAENFNEMYGLIESKYPDAIKKGGIIKKVKPAKVRVVKAKKAKRVEDARDFLANLSPEQKKIMDSRMRKKLSVSDIEFIESTLTNDEASTDEELIEHFISEIDITKAQAKKWVGMRDKYLQQPVEKAVSYSVRTKLKKEARQKSSKVVVKTRDGFNINRRDPKNKGEKFYDENGKQWECVRYDTKLEECILKDEEGKEISACLEDMYKFNPVEKREKGNLVDECKDTLKEAGFTVKEHKAGKKKIRRREPRPEKDIIKERVGDTFTPILKDISNSEDKKKENKAVIDALGRVEKLIVKFFNRLNNLAEDGKADAIEKIEKLLEALVD